MPFWTIDFMTRAGRSIHIQISGKNGSTDEALIPSDNPCCFEEEGREDLFMPIKTQSGYIEVITDDISLASQIIPTKGGTRQVRVFETATPTAYTEPLWIGWVQPKLLSFKLWNGKQKLQIPIECLISGMRYKPVNMPPQNKINIGVILYRILGAFSYAYFQGGIVLGGEMIEWARAWTHKKVYSSLFDEDSTQYDVLEKLCVFFGWTARQYKQSIYFVANRNVDAVNTSVRKVLAADLADSTYSTAAQLWQEVQLDGSMLVNTSNNVKFFEGCNIAKATCQLITFDQDIALNFTEISTAIDNGTITTQNNKSESEWSEGGHDYYRVTNDFWVMFGATPITVGNFTIQGYNVEPILNKNGSTDINDWSTNLLVWYTTDYTLDTYWVEGEPGSPSYQTTDIRIDTETVGYLEFASANPVSYDTAGTLVVNAAVDTEYDKYRGACFFVKIGNLWYNPVNNSWQTTKPTTYIKLDVDNHDGYSINIPQAMSGTLVLQFVPDYGNLSANSYVGQAYALKSASAEFTAVQSETYNSQINEVEASAKNSTGFDNEVNFDSLICLKRALVANSKNFLLDASEQPSQGLYDTLYRDAQLFDPLQRLCDQAAEELSKTGRLYEIYARWRAGLTYDITPITMVYVDPLNEWCYPVSVKYNLRDDEVLLRLIKRTYSEGNQ